MLIEIKCSEFKHDKHEGLIRLNSGLNIVLGSKSAANSIGKSTFLQIIDFAFGGKTYVESNSDLANEIGPHTIYFAFKFRDEVSKFSRSFDKPGTVSVCDSSYLQIDSWSIEKFNNWLLERYGMSKLGGTFRYLVGPFLRIYGKGNLDEKRPLRADTKEAEKIGINRLICLFGKNFELSELKENAASCVSESKAFVEAIKYRIIAPVKNETEAKKNLAEIEELKNELNSILKENEVGAADIDSASAVKLTALKEEIASLSRQREWLKADLSQIDEDASIGKATITKDFKFLAEFFPDANIRRFEEIENFHKSLKKALNSERKSVKNRTIKELEVIDSRIQTAESELKEIGSIPNVAEAVLRAYAHIEGKISELEIANDLFYKKNKLKADAKIAAKLAEDKELSLLSGIKEHLNQYLKSLSTQISGTNVYPPELEINSPSSYSLFIPHDTGTGSLTKATFLLDFALLQDTPLPIVVHDTVMTKQVQDETIVRLLNLYQTTHKQIFVAIDKAETFVDGPLPEVVERNTIISLSEDSRLFGRPFNLKAAY